MIFANTKDTVEIDELEKDFEHFLDKYEITEGICLFSLEKDGKIMDKVVIFNDSKNQFSLCNFAKLIMSCMGESKLFKHIIDHTNEHIVQALLQTEKMRYLLGKRGKTSQIN